MDLRKVEVWLRGMIAAVISGAAGGVLNGFAAMGIRPDVFNMNAGFGATLKMAGAAAAITALIGLAAYLQKSPLPD
jgi:Na+/serine symporter